VSSVLIPSYAASLVSFLAQQTPYRPFDSLDTMVADGSYRLLVKDNTAEHAFFSVSLPCSETNKQHRKISGSPDGLS